jgi:hypothetical protein
MLLLNDMSQRSVALDSADAVDFSTGKRPRRNMID